jgi:UDP-3-O-acyl-N-acetylglucosamine deacetylase
MIEGLGLHSGVPTRVTIRPADDGLWFRYGAQRWQAIPENVSDTARCTKLGEISTIEHLMSAFAGLQITDAEVEVSEPELPAAGGSAFAYVELLNTVGRTELASREVRDIFSRVFVQDGVTKIAIADGSGHWAYRYETGERWPHSMEFELRDLPAGYDSEVAAARTFGLIEELPHLERLGLARGLDETSALVLGPDGFINEARFPDEPARHKMLDMIGDLYLSGVPIHELDVVGERCGHRMNVEAAAKLYAGTTI